MRASSQVIGILALLWFGLAESGLASRDCPGIEPFLDKLKAHTLPEAEDFPDLTVCGPNFEPELASALAAYITTKPKPRAAQVESVIAIIRDAHQKATWESYFKTFSEALKSEAGKKQLEFELNSSGDGFALLDPLVEKLKSPEPAETPAPVVDPTPPGSSGPAHGRSPANPIRRPVANPIGPASSAPSSKGRSNIALGLLALLSVTNFVLLIYLLAQRFRNAGTQADPPKPPLPQVTGGTLPESDQAVRQIEGRVGSLEDGLKRATEGVTMLGTGLETFEAKLESAQGALQENARKEAEWNTRLATIENDLAMLPPEVTKKEVELLKRHVSALYAKAQQGNVNPDKAPFTPNNSLPLERAVLSEAWKRFRENKEIVAALESAPEANGWQQIQAPLLVNLPEVVPEDLKPSLDAVLAPARDYHNMVAKLALVPRLVSGDLPPLTNEAEELMRLRELSQLLTMTQNSNLVADRLRFRLERWIQDNFLGFADLFLQRYQKAKLDGKADRLETGYGIVRQVLQAAGLQPIDITLGSTPFDSSRHIGRSTRCEPDYPDGVILEVVRNGFIRDEREVMRQPEVTVNRVR